MRTALPLVVVCFTLAGSHARAAVTVSITPGAGADFARQAGVPLDQVQSQLQSELNALFAAQRPQDYLRRFSDAQAFTTRSLGVDYASNLRAVMVGVAGNVSINAEEGFVPKDTRSPPPVEALATNVTIMGGVNLGLIGLRPITVFANYWKSSGSYREFDASLENRGLHVQLKVFGPDADESVWHSLFRWGGIDVTTGFDYARTTLHLARTQTFTRAIPVGSLPAEQAPRVTLDSMGTLDLDMRTWSIPLEVTTNVRLLQLVSVYGGVGFDWQLGGGGDMNIQLSGRMTGTVPGQSTTYDIGTASITEDESSEPSKGRLRGLAGVQLNLWIVKLFTQLNFVPDPFAASFAFGGRVAW